MANVRSSVYLLVMFCLISALSSGCNKSEPTQQKHQQTKLEYFKERQAATMTTNGKIKMDTIQETPDGRIQYQTDDGKTWRVTMTKQADGTYSYGMPDEVR